MGRAQLINPDVYKNIKDKIKKKHWDSLSYKSNILGIAIILFIMWFLYYLYNTYNSDFINDDNNDYNEDFSDNNQYV